MIDIFIPSYHRPTNLKSVKYFLNLGWDIKKIHVVIDSEADDEDLYKESAKELGYNLLKFDIEEARNRYDNVHRASLSRRGVGQARNLIYDLAEQMGITFFMIMDDDTIGYQKRPYCVYKSAATLEDCLSTFDAIKEFMQRQHIGCFALSQTGDMFERFSTRLMRKKVMNTTFYDTRFIYAGEKGQNDPDTSLFVGILNEGLFTGSPYGGLVLQQTASATAKGGLTELYNEAKLLSKSLIIPIQFPSLSRAEKQKMNGGRLHHRINYRNLAAYVIRGERSNIAWDTYAEDGRFTNEPKRKIKK